MITTALFVKNSSSLPNYYVLFLAEWIIYRNIRLHVLIDFFNDVLHHFLDVDVVLGGYLEILHLMFLRYLLCFVTTYNSLLLQVQFIAHQYFRNARVCMFVNAGDPSLDVLEGLLVCQIESYDHAVSSSVKLVSYSLEPFLSSSIPDLDFELLAVSVINGLNKVHSY